MVYQDFSLWLCDQLDQRGKENVVIDALFLKYEEEGSHFSFSFIVHAWMNEISNAWFTNLNNPSLIQYFQHDSTTYLGYT